MKVKDWRDVRGGILKRLGSIDRQMASRVTVTVDRLSAALQQDDILLCDEFPHATEEPDLTPPSPEDVPDYLR